MIASGDDRTPRPYRGAMDDDRPRPVQVEVADDDAPVAWAGDGGAGRSPGRVRRWWAAGLAVALVVGLVGAAQVSDDADRRDDADVARLAGRHGFTASLREPLVELWSSTDRLLGAGAGVVLLEDRGSDPSRLVGRDAGTGDVRWTGGWASPAEVARCAEAAGLLLCEVAGSGYGSPNTDEMLGEIPGGLLAVDPEDGAVVAGWELDGRAVGWAVVEDDAVVARRSGSHLEVVRHDVSTSVLPDGGASPVWSTTVPLPDGVTANQLTLREDHGAVVVEGRVGSVLDAADGGVLVPPQRADGAGLPVRVEVSTAGTLVWRTADVATWFGRPAGGPSWLLPGRPVQEVADDGSSPEVVLVERDGRLVAVDALTGMVLWERAGAAWRRVARVAGAAVLVEPGLVVGVDVTTGEESWRLPVPVRSQAPAPGPGALALDARRALLGEALTGGQPAAVELEEGTQIWVLPDALRGALRAGTGPAVVLAVTDRGVSAGGRSPS